MITRADIVSAGTELAALDIPWHPSGADEKAGCNCIGLMVLVARRCGLDDLLAAFKPYIGMREPEHRKGLLMALRGAMDFVPPAKAQPGDLLLFKLRGRQHGDPELTHVALSMPAGQILESVCLDRKHRTGRVVLRQNPYRIHSAWAVPNVHN